MSLMSAPGPVFGFETVRSDAYWRVVLERGRLLFQSKENGS